MLVFYGCDDAASPHRGKHLHPPNFALEMWQMYKISSTTWFRIWMIMIQEYSRWPRWGRLSPGRCFCASTKFGVRRMKVEIETKDSCLTVSQSSHCGFFGKRSALLLENVTYYIEKVKERWNTLTLGRRKCWAKHFGAAAEGMKENKSEPLVWEDPLGFSVEIHWPSLPLHQFTCHHFFIWFVYLVGTSKEYIKYYIRGAYMLQLTFNLFRIL